MREDLIRDAIRNLPGSHFERFVRRLLREHYPGWVPTSESHDLGQDARTEETTRFMNGNQWVSLVASKVATLANLRSNCMRNKQEGNRIDIVVFAIPQTPREPTIKEWRAAIKKEFKWKLEVRTLDFLTETACEPKHENLVDEYLNLPPPGGDFVREIEKVFTKHTAKALRDISTTIPGLPSPIPRDEVSSVEDQVALGNSVLLTGEAGIGKSGIALALARSAMEQQQKQVLFIDARQLGYVQNDGQLQQHFSLKGSLDEAVKRLARHTPNGVRVVIDQADNAVGSRSAEVLVDFAISLHKADRVDLIVISRSREGHEGELLRKLQLNRFVELTSYPLAAATAASVLGEVGIGNPSETLIELATNLLNLSLIGGIRESQPTFDFSRVFDEVDLWESYLRAIKERESHGDTFERGERMIAEAARLAKLGLKDSRRCFALDHPHTLEQRRLESCGLICLEAGDIFRFRHEKLQDFMFAWDATRLAMMPSEVVCQIGDRFRTRNVIRWVQQLYTKHQPKLAARALKELAQSGLPFYTRAAALDAYIQSPQMIRDVELLSEILGTIQAQPDLRAYFFRSRPHPMWALILSEAGLLEKPPEPERVDEDHISIPRWDVQDFLLSVAPYVPDVVLNHVDRLLDRNYLIGALQALCLIPADLAETRVGVIARWINELDDLWAIADETIELIKKLANEQRYDSALRLTSALTVPIPSKNVRRIEIESMGSYWTMNSEARSKVGDWEHRGGLSELSNVFLDTVPLRFAGILEEQLCSALRLEAEAEQRPEAEFESSWRQAIGQTGQDLASKYKDYLLMSLRDVLVNMAQREPVALRPLLQRYLSEKRGILRRLALHIVSRFPRDYDDYATTILTRPENFDDLSIYHEFFQLLQNGYSTLAAADRQVALNAILRGPDLEEFRDRLKDRGDEPESVDAYLHGYSQRWIRDRLWMIKDNLDAESAGVLERLVAEQGIPDHPGFLSWSSFGAGDNSEGMSVVEEEEITSQSPEELVAFLKEWRPSDEGTRRPSIRDMAAALASAMLRHLPRYSDRLIDIALVRPEFADALVNRLIRGDEVQAEQWIAGLELSDQLLNDQTVRTDLTRVSDVCWVDVRRSIARSLGTQLEKARGDGERIDRYLPLDTLSRVRGILLTLLRDGDTGAVNDQSNDDSGISDDALTTSMNHVRPVALTALIDSECCRLFRSPDYSDRFGPSRLDPVVRAALTEQLNQSSDPSEPLHAVFGRHLLELTWLDEAWTLAQLDAIFPTDGSAKDASRFCAAFDAFAWRRRQHIYPVLFDALRPKYRQAIENLQRDASSRHNLNGEGMAAQLVCDFLNSDYEIIASTGEESLIAEFFRQSPEPARSSAAWLLWDIWRQCAPELADQFWKRTRLLWEWRVGEASRMNHPNDLDGEMNWYARLAVLAPNSETVASLWPLMEGVLPHLRGARRGHIGWDDMESYLAREVERDRLRSVRMYRLMHERQRNAQVYAVRYENETKILETALEGDDSRADALAVINLIAAKGSDRHRQLYERYTR